MGVQSKAFLEGEGEAWLKRNKGKLPVEDDPVLFALEMYPEINPKKVLEIGCADGWRLKKLQSIYKCEITGVEPGAVHGGGEWIYRGTADDLPFSQQSRAAFDLVIYGFCLYLCDREDLFRIAAEGDRVLKDRGYLVVYDFHAPRPFAREYVHRKPLKSYKMDYSKLWLANPAYSLVTRQYFGSDDDQTSVVILQKDIGAAWPIKK